MTIFVEAHICGGSQVEAAEPQGVYGPFESRPEAQRFADEFTSICRAADPSYLGQELICFVIIMNDGHTDAAAAAARFLERMGL